jgi:hypothetical protein
VQLLYHFQKDLLYTVFGFFFIFQVFHAYTQQKESVPLQQNAQPLIIMVGIKLFKQFLIGYMLEFVSFHYRKIAIC